MSLFAWECALACGLLVPAQDAPAKTQPATNATDIFTIYDFIVTEVTPVILAQVGAAAGPRPAVAEEIEVIRALLPRKLPHLRADNGKPFTPLREAERRPVVVTFRGPRAAAQWLSGSTSPPQPAATPLTVSGGTLTFGRGTATVEGGGPMPFTAAPPQTA